MGECKICGKEKVDGYNEAREMLCRGCYIWAIMVMVEYNLLVGEV